MCRQWSSTVRLRLQVCLPAPYVPVMSAHNVCKPLDPGLEKVEASVLTSQRNCSSSATRKEWKNERSFLTRKPRAPLRSGWRQSRAFARANSKITLVCPPGGRAMPRSRRLGRSRSMSSRRHCMVTQPLSQCIRPNSAGPLESHTRLGDSRSFPPIRLK